MTPTAAAVCEALAALGLPNLAVIADPGDVAALDLVRAAPEAYGLAPAPSDAAISQTLRRLLAEDPEARIVLADASCWRSAPWSSGPPSP